MRCMELVSSSVSEGLAADAVCAKARPRWMPSVDEINEGCYEHAGDVRRGSTLVLRGHSQFKKICGELRWYTTWEQEGNIDRLFRRPRSAYV